MPDDRRLQNRRARLGRRESELRAEGFRFVAGADEAGAGPLAGPLVGAAVVLPARAQLPGVFDSKQLTPAQRDHWAVAIRQQAIGYSVIEVPSTEVDAIGPYRAALLAMTRAVQALDPAADYLLVDARRLPHLGIPQEPVVKGDTRHLAIAAASILAKTYRDARMIDLDSLYPGYGFAQHKGYGTQAHLEALQQLGPCPEHRLRYAPVRAALGQPQARLLF